MLVRNAYWRSLSPKEKFDLLLLHSNFHVIAGTVVQKQKNKSHTQRKA